MQTTNPQFTPNIPSLDVAIPCFNAEKTLARAVNSALTQSACQKIYLVDDASTDGTRDLIEQYAARYPEKITALFLPNNCGVAYARNWAALNSQADLLAFLDADDAYQAHALDILPSVFAQMPELSLVRLKLTPIDLAPKYTQHPQFVQAWDILQMTVGGNTIFRRALFLACGGFPQDALFHRLGGEDGALGIALTQCTRVGTLFDEAHAGVLHYCREGMHAQRLLEASLFGRTGSAITPEDVQAANQVSARIIEQLHHIKGTLNHMPAGRVPLLVKYANN